MKETFSKTKDKVFNRKFNVVDFEYGNFFSLVKIFNNPSHSWNELHIQRKTNDYSLFVTYYSWAMIRGLNEMLFLWGVGIWKSGVPCGSRPTDQRSVSHNIKPCCINTRGDCRMVSHQHCHFLKGTFHQQDNEEHCSQVCKMNKMYSETWLIWHALGEKFCVRIDRMLDYTV